MLTKITAKIQANNEDERWQILGWDKRNYRLFKNFEKCAKETVHQYDLKKHIEDEKVRVAMKSRRKVGRGLSGWQRDYLRKKETWN